MVLSEGLTKALRQANDRLKRGKIGVTLTVQGKEDWLYLRGTFPPKPTSQKTESYQQRIALKARANCLEVIKQAELMAKVIGLDLNLGKFSWSQFGDFEKKTPNPTTAQGWAEAFSKWWWEDKDPSDTQKRNTWRSRYKYPFGRLPEEKPLTEQLLVDLVVAHTKPNTPIRNVYVMAYSCLADFAKLPKCERLERLAKRVGQKTVNPRDLPSDELIAQIRNEIQHPGWQYIYGLLAAYGLRPHEVFFLNYENYPILETSDTGKTRKKRFVKPLYPEWAEEWKLEKVVMPIPRARYSKETANHTLGARISDWFYRNIPFTAYNLRHAYAQRGIFLGIPDASLAYMMGHSLQMHTKVYRAWLDEQVYLQGADRALQRSDRPLPPQT